MVETEILHEREIEAGGDHPGAHMTCQGCFPGDAIARHRGLVIGPGDLVRDPDGEGRKIVEEEGVKMVVGVDHEHVRRRVVQERCDLRVELRGSAIRPLFATSAGKFGVCGTPNAATISAMFLPFRIARRLDSSVALDLTFL
jgi:hypothetical protein